MTVQIKVAERDKAKMVESLRAGAKAATDINNEAPIPPLTQVVEEKDGWISFGKPMLYFYAGQGPYVGRCVAMFNVNNSVLIFYQ